MIAVGDVVWVTVERITDYGAWVRVDGVDDMRALVHLPDVAWARAWPVTDHVPPAGGRMRAKVLRVDRDRMQVSLGLKQLTPDPWEVHAERLRPGEVLTGRVVPPLADYGVFVELFAGVEGLVHVDELGAPEGTHPAAFELGAEMRVRVLSVEPEERRLRLARAG